MPLIEPSKKAPSFSLKDQHGNTHRLTDSQGRHVSLYFYPKDDSILDEASKSKFATKHGLTFPLLADANHEVAEKYGVWQQKSRYGRSYMGIVRTTYLIGPDGKVVERWDNVKVDGHADTVAAAIS